VKYIGWTPPALGIVAITVFGTAGLSAESISWHATFDDALDAAQESGRLVLVDFHAEWCDPCKALEHETFPAPEVVNAAAAYECVRVDVDRHPELAMRYEVQSIPNIALLSPAGKPLHGIMGFYPPQAFADVLAAASPLGRQAAALENAPDDPRVNYEMAMTYLDLGRSAPALPLFEKVLQTARPGGLRDPQERRQARDLRAAAQTGRDACLAVGEKPRKAISRLQKSLKQNPRAEHAAMIKWYIAAAYFTIDDFDRAIQCGEQLLRQHEHSPWAMRVKPLVERAKQLAT
jgi:thioredoxin 1